jgi:hypothetical protein
LNHFSRASPISAARAIAVHFLGYLTREASHAGRKTAVECQLL